MSRQDSRIVPVEDGYMLRFKTETKIFEVNYNLLTINEVSLYFNKTGQKVGSLYEEGNSLYAHLDSVGEDDFMGFKLPKDVVEEIIKHGLREGIIDEDDSTVARFIARFDLDIPSKFY